MRRLVIIPLLVFDLFSSQAPFAGPASFEAIRAPDTIVVTPGPLRTFHTAVPAASAAANPAGMDGHSSLSHSDPNQWVYGSAGYRNRDSCRGGNGRRFETGTVIQDMPLPDSSQLSAGLFVENSWLVNTDLEVNTGLHIDRVSAGSDPLSTSRGFVLKEPGINAGICWMMTF